MAARAQLVETVIRPALDRGELVLADRFVPSTLAYQGDAGGVRTDEIETIARIATGGLVPDLVVLIDIDEETAAGRLGGELDRIESRARYESDAKNESSSTTSSPSSTKYGLAGSP